MSAMLQVGWSCCGCTRVLQNKHGWRCRRSCVCLHQPSQRTAMEPDQTSVSIWEKGLHVWTSSGAYWGYQSRWIPRLNERLFLLQSLASALQCIWQMIFSDEQILQWVLLMRIQGEVECTYIMVQLQSFIKNLRFVEGVACINFIFFIYFIY